MPILKEPFLSLDDHRHALMIGRGAGGSGKGAGTGEICRGIDQFDGGQQVLEADRGVRMIVGDHVGFVQAGIGPVLGILSGA